MKISKQIKEAYQEFYANIYYTIIDNNKSDYSNIPEFTEEYDIEEYDIEE